MSPPPVTEKKWLKWSTYPGGLAECFRGQVGPRKGRLFAVALCRRVAHLLPDDRRLPRGIEVAERYAEGQATREELILAHASAEAAVRRLAANPRRCGMAATKAAAQAVGLATHPTSLTYAAGVVCHVGDAAAYAALRPDAPCSDSFRPPTSDRWYAAKRAEYEAQGVLLQDAYGNPLRPTAAAASVLAWNDRAIPRLGQAIHDDRTFERLPIVADALEEAGCTDSVILRHCRSNEAHVRGCWLVDLLRGVKPHRPRTTARP